MTLEQPRLQVKIESFHWSDHPWISLLVLTVMTVVGAFGNILLTNFGLDIVIRRTRARFKKDS